MKPRTLERYRLLSKAMLELSSQLAATLQDAGPIGVQLFLCCNLGGTWKQPTSGLDDVWHKQELSHVDASSRWLGRSLEPPPLTDRQWAQLVAANWGKLPADVADWERWERFSDRTACYRYFGCGNRDVSYKIDSPLRKAGLLLRKYEKLRIPERLEWKTPSAIRYFYDCSLSCDEALLELVCRSMGDQREEEAVLLKEAGLEPLFPAVLNDDWSGEITLGKMERYGLELFQIDDLADAFSKAVERWIPQSSKLLEVTIIDPNQDEGPTQLPEAEPEPQDIPVGPKVGSVTIGWGESGYWAEAAGGGPRISFEDAMARVLDCFVIKIARKAETEVVHFCDLHPAIFDIDANPATASKALRKTICNLNNKFGSLGTPLDDKQWFRSERRAGYRLNHSVCWSIDKKSMGRRRSMSVWSIPVDPTKLDNNTIRPGGDSDGDDE